MKNTNTKQNSHYNITQGAMALIEGVVERTKITDPQKLVPEVCEELVTRYGNGEKRLAYHLKQMQLTTTAEVRRAIDCFFIYQRLFLRDCA